MSQLLDHQIGNILESKETVIKNIGQNPIYNLMTNNPPVTSFCIKCYADYHLFNLYFNGHMTLDELGRTRPLYRGPKVRQRLQELKKILNENTDESKDIKRYV